jgi:hypothetical protein
VPRHCLQALDPPSVGFRNEGATSKPAAFPVTQQHMATPVATPESPLSLSPADHLVISLPGDLPC